MLDHAHGFLVPFALHRVLNLAGDPGKQRVIGPHHDVDAGMHHRAAVAPDDLAGIPLLGTVPPDAETLGLRSAAVSRAAASLLVCHGSALDVVDADLGEGLPMALRFLKVLAPAQLEDAYLLAAAVRENRRLDRGAGNQRRAELHRVAGADEQYLAERDRRADIAFKALDADLLPCLNLVLFAARLDDRVHENYALRLQILGIISDS